MADNALVALTLLIAESKPAEKDIICKVIVNLINRENLCSKTIAPGGVPWYVAGVLNKGRNGEGNEPLEAFPDAGERMANGGPGSKERESEADFCFRGLNLKGRTRANTLGEELQCLS